jgi:hypothetical protein
LHPGHEPVHVGVDVARDAVLHRGRHLGGGETHDGQAGHHRFAHRQSEARPPDGVEQKAVAGGEGRQAGRLHLAEPAQLLRPHADEVEGHLPADGLEHVGAEAPPPAGEMVHDHQTPFELARPADAVGQGDAVVDDRGRDGTVVPHEPVEGGDVDDEDVGIVDGMAGVGR